MTRDDDPYSRFLEIQEYVEWNASDGERVHTIAPRLLPSLPAIIDDFYAAIDRRPDLRKIFTGGEAQIARLKGSLSEWLRALLYGPYDAAYFESRWRVGYRHVEIGLDMTSTIVALTRLRSGLIRAAGESLPATRLSADEQSSAQGPAAAVASLMKLVDLDLAIISDAYRTAYVARYHDTERRLQSERLVAMGAAMAALAHESRNALQRSQACLEMLIRRIADRPEAVELAQSVQKAQDDLHRLYEEVREYAAPVRLKLEPTDLSEVVRHAWHDLNLQWRNRMVRLRETRTNVDLSCEIDRFAVRQVFVNVLENSLGACRDPVEIDVSYSDASLLRRPAVRVSVRDNGHGLSPDQRDRIFDEFYTTKTHGTGLGLAICKRLVEAHAGIIAAGDNPAPGTEIIVILPREQPA